MEVMQNMQKQALRHAKDTLIVKCNTLLTGLQLRGPDTWKQAAADVKSR